MITVVPVIGYTTVYLKQAYIYHYIGRGNKYKYQTNGVGTVTVLVSEDAITWYELTTLTNTETKLLSHTYPYQMITETDLEVSVIRSK